MGEDRRSSSIIRGVISLIIAMPAGSLVPEPGWAQALEEIIVTTRRREESLQDVPIAVDAFSAEQIRRFGMRDLAAITKYSPSVRFDNNFGPSDNRVTIRGLSNTRGRSNVAFLVDGIDVTTENLQAFGSGLLVNQRLLNDVERIEIVKGPQSALYGRSAFAGAISYVTGEPGDSFESSVTVDIAEDEMYELSGIIGGPVTDTLGLRLNGVAWNHGGHFKNSVPGGDDVGGGEGYGASLTTVWQPTEDVRIKFRGSYSDDEYDPPATVRFNEDTVLPHPDSPVVCPEPGSPFEITGVGVGGFNGIATGLCDFGDSVIVPGLMGSSGGYQVRHSEDFVTGEDYTGTESEVTRLTLIATWNVPWGTLSSYTGYTDADQFSEYDQDYQAQGRPDTLLGSNRSRTTTETEQLSQEFRFASSWEGPLQLTLGGLYWDEERRINDRNNIVSCLTTTKVNGVLTTNPEICDGGIDSRGRQTVATWQEYSAQLEPYTGSNWGGDTEHLSIYGMLEWTINDQWKLTGENRYFDEHLDIVRPNLSSCTNLAFSGGGNPSAIWQQEDDNFDALCASAGGDPRWELISGEETDHYHVPRIILEWTPTDDALVFLSWAKARKPAGINVVPAGGSPTTIEEERYDPEKMDAYELGAKTNWEAAGDLILNGSIFYQDYSDKQVGTQILGPNGNLQPRVINASSAEVYGLEVEVTWAPAAVEGLTLSASYTYLDAEYDDFQDNTTSLVRASMAGECPPFVPQPGGRAFCRLDLSGKKLERTPENAFVGVISVNRPLFDTGLSWFGDFTAVYTDEIFDSVDNVVGWQDLWLADLRLGVESERWEALVYVNNVFDDDTFQTGGNGPDFGQQVVDLGFTAGLGVSHWFGELPDPRIIGVRATYRFGD